VNHLGVKPRGTRLVSSVDQLLVSPLATADVPYRSGKGLIYTDTERFGMEQSPIPEIIEAIAEVKGTEPSELDLTLYEYIEPEAIQQLVSHGTASWTLSFELPEHQVAITNEGAVLVDGAERRHLTKSL